MSDQLSQIVRRSPHLDRNGSDSNRNKTFFSKVVRLIRELFSSNYRSTLNSRQRVAVNYVRLIVAALISSIIFQYFLKNTLLSTGVSGIGLMINNIILSHQGKHVFPPALSNSILYLLFFGLNIPFFIFAFRKKLNKKFIVNTFIFLVFMLLWGLLLPKPHVDSHFFGWVTAIHQSVQNAIISNLHHPFAQQYGFIWKLLLLALLASVLKAFALFIIYGSSATTGGTDFIAFKFSLTSKHNFAFMTGVCNSFIIIIVLYFNYQFNNFYHYHKYQGVVEFYTSFKTFATFIYVISFTLIINFVYPIKQKLFVAIVSRKSINVFYKYFIHSNKSNYSHSFTIIQSPGLLTKQSAKQHTFITISTLFEYDSLKHHIQKIDPRAFVYIIKVAKVLGNYKEVLI